MNWSFRVSSAVQQESHEVTKLMKRQVVISPDHCTGCLRCALACSYFTTKEREFNLSKARIKVLPGWQQRDPEVSLDGECNHCGICVEYCEFGVLSRAETGTRAGPESSE